MTTLAAKLPDVMRGDDLILSGIILATVVGIAAIIVPIAIHLRERKVISVDFEILSDVKLMDSDAADAFSSRIEVTYNGRALAHPRIVDVKVKNTGNNPVGAADYVEPIVFQLESGQPPIDATIIAASKPGIAGDLFESTEPPRAMSIRPQLLNQGESFTLRMLFDDKDSRVIGSHRIPGALSMRHVYLDALTPAGRFSRGLVKVWGIAVIPCVIASILLSHNVAEAILFIGASVGGFGGIISVISLVHALVSSRSEPD